MIIKVTLILSPTPLSSAHMIKAIAVQSTILVWGRRSGYSSSSSSSTNSNSRSSSGTSNNLSFDPKQELLTVQQLLLSCVLSLGELVTK